MFGKRPEPGPGIGARLPHPGLEHEPGELPQAIDEDAHLRAGLAALGPVAVRELRDVLTWPEPRRDALHRALIGRPGAEALAQLIAVATADKVAELRMLRAIRDVTGEAPRRRALA
jgi:hypothetical protein